MSVPGRRRMSFAEAGMKAAKKKRKSSNLRKIESKKVLLAATRLIEEIEEEGEEATIPITDVQGVAEVPVGRHKRKGDAGEFKFNNEFHKVMFRFVESKLFSGFILGIILLNTGILVGQTFPSVAARGSWYFSALDNIFLAIYIMEAVLKIYVWRKAFFKEGWNIMDFTIVMFSMMDFMLPLVMSAGGFNGAAIFRLLRIFKAIRAIRALRVLRTIRFLANLQVIVTTCLQSIQSMGAIVMLMFLFMYMFAVIGRGLYSKVDEERFGSLFDAIFTTFQLLTLDDWFDIYINASNKGRNDIIYFLITYILVEYFVFLNLFVAVLVDNFQLTLQAQNKANKEKQITLDESDDEDVLAISDTSEESSVTDMSDEEKPQRKAVDDYYHDKSHSEREALNRYFQLLTSLEYNTQMLHNQQRTIDLMVDMCAITEDDD